MKTIILSVMISFASVAIGQADELLDSYMAYISENDLYNSKGQRLTQPWQIIRQDRANFHHFGESDEWDSEDSFFASLNNRAIAERMLQNGQISSSAAQSIVDGNVIIVVEIYGENGFGEYLHVSVQ